MRAIETVFWAFVFGIGEAIFLAAPVVLALRGWWPGWFIAGATVAGHVALYIWADRGEKYWRAKAIATAASSIRTTSEELS